MKYVQSQSSYVMKLMLTESIRGLKVDVVVSFEGGL